jgi:hypothetical protein
MSWVRHTRKYQRAFIVYALIAHLLLICAAAASPAIHEWMHPDADCADHECAVTLYVSGACHETAPPVLALAPDRVLLLDALPPERAVFDSSYRFNGILEHAPPGLV